MYSVLVDQTKMEKTIDHFNENHFERAFQNSGFFENDNPLLAKT